MLQLRKMNYEDILEQWQFSNALPADENGFTNPYGGVSSFRVIMHNGAYIAGEDEDHYLLRVAK